ncbi:MAG: transcriptional regulator [Candidatus Harrisonbacteria bacterium CG10_big_fil_rev_8_21_14_0_10_49_15]|uniref:Transcriptional regulator n=1 Tax=Candidatus Harrisonbacteria bacterium CG10_big_fil_rev_8_21_14_0_10_49_15 TaxID=1974587 RepID=A0A2H0UK43_9BACT|nr:MAG: transcriptional regulator [Candidatus Harrisonbacteria bacterium CG10_big_fil_rev_8_21_14_0_10_49_15]
MTQRTGSGSPKPEYRKELLQLIATAAKDKRLLDDLLQDLLTPAEYREMANRWQIVKRLEQGMNQREIAGELHVGLATVVRGARALLRSRGGFRKLLDR